jgi:hypothetical protein
MRDKMSLYICKRCNVLLIQIDGRYVEYTCETLHEEGEYMNSHDASEHEFDYYLCPMCSGISIEKEGRDLTLHALLLPVSLARTLLQVWIKNKVSASTKIQWLYGLPLDEVEVKTLLLEYLI